MSKDSDTFYFSPSVIHRYWMDQVSPSHAYNGGAIPRWKHSFRHKLRELVGEMPGEKSPLNPRSLWNRDHPLGRIEKIVFTSEPYSDVPAYVCIPEAATKPLTFVICLQGHSTGMHLSIGVDKEDEMTPIDVAGDRDFALACMRRGIAALCIEQRSFGERAERVQEMIDRFNTCHDASMHALMLGRTLLGERIFDVERAIDYLASRGDVDMGRIGIMGNSGGGTVSIYAAALLPRISFAMPSCCFCTYRDSIMSIYHCADNYIPGMFKVADLPDVMGLFAPKPVVIVAGKEDFIFPIKGVRKAFYHLQRIYSASGAGDHCHLVVGDEGHRFYADRAWPVLMAQLEEL